MDDHSSIGSTRRCLFPDETSFDDTSSAYESFPRSHRKDRSSRSQGGQRGSPTGVIFNDSELDDLLLQEEDFHTPMRPKIVMGNEGAEVTFHALVDRVVTPQKSTPRKKKSPKGTILGEVRNNSLLDFDNTPTRPNSKTKPPRRRGLAELRCAVPTSGSQCTQKENVVITPSKRDMEESIVGKLGEKDTPTKVGQCGMMCSDWQLWSISTTPKKQSKDTKVDMMRANLQKRAVKIKSRNTRVRQLRRDLSPFGQSPSRNSPEFVRSRSFSISDHAPAIVRTSKEIQRQKNSFARVFTMCTLPENATSDSPLILKPSRSIETEEPFYDSDPEDFAKQRSPRRSAKENYAQDIFTSQYRVQGAPSDFMCKSIVQEFINTSFTLVYHPTEVNDVGALEASNPVAVEAWLERGQQLCDIIQPKMMWKTKPRYKKRQARLQKTRLQTIELLSISRVTKPDQMDRSLHPLARTQRCIILRTIEGDAHCFEAKSQAERDHIVFSLKLAIARFGAMVLASDEAVYEEFFASDDGVPGDAPDVFAVLEDSDSDSSFELDC